jgi:hypothetical protein
MSTVGTQAVEPWKPAGEYDNPDLKKRLKCFLWHELNRARGKTLIPKNLPPAEYQAKMQSLLASGKWLPPIDDGVNMVFNENIPKPTALFAPFDGTYGELDEFIHGKWEDDGQTKTMVSLSHPRTWVAAYPGAYGNPPIYITDHDEALAMAKKGNFSEVKEVTWTQLLDEVKKAEDARRRQ